MLIGLAFSNLSNIFNGYCFLVFFLNILNFCEIMLEITSSLNHEICQKMICLQKPYTLTLMVIRLTFGLYMQPKG